MDGTRCTLRTLLAFLHREGYKQTLLDYDDKETDVLVVVIPYPQDEKKDRDLGYELHYFETANDLEDFGEALFCGGLYTTALTFVKGRNLSAHSCLQTLIYPGDNPID